MTRILLAIAMAGALTAPAFAQSDETTCADFTAMDSEGQTQAMTDLHAKMAVSGEATSETEAMAPEMMASEAVAACDAHPDMTVEAAMGEMEGG